MCNKINESSGHDISGDKVKLNIDTLIKVAASAVYNARCQMDKWQNEIDALVYDHNKTELDKTWSRAWYAKHLLDATNDYTMAFDSYSALLHAKDRQTIEIIK